MVLQHASLCVTSSCSVFRGMTFEEKRKLSQRISSLNDDQLAPVVTIIAEALGPLSDANGEVELDIDTLGDDLLWKLDDYINVHCDEKNKVRVLVVEFGFVLVLVLN